jgi:hypothetical protein
VWVDELIAAVDRGLEALGQGGVAVRHMQQSAQLHSALAHRRWVPCAHMHMRECSQPAKQRTCHTSPNPNQRTQRTRGVVQLGGGGAQSPSLVTQVQQLE